MLIKREEFAISLRKQKKAKILELKRRKIYEQVPVSQIVAFTHDSHQYSIYPAFGQDDSLLPKLLNEIAPDLNSIVGNLSQLQYLLECLEQSRSALVYNLAVITKIRFIFQTEYTNLPKILETTQILVTCCKVLQFKVDSDEVYCMKLEALWILINVAKGDIDEIKMMLETDNLVDMINTHLQTQDTKIFYHTCWLLNNIAATSSKIAKQMLT